MHIGSYQPAAEQKTEETALSCLAHFGHLPRMIRDVLGKFGPYKDSAEDDKMMSAFDLLLEGEEKTRLTRNLEVVTHERVDRGLGDQGERVRQPVLSSSSRKAACPRSGHSLVSTKASSRSTPARRADPSRAELGACRGLRSSSRFERLLDCRSLSSVGVGVDGEGDAVVGGAVKYAREGVSYEDEAGRERKPKESLHSVSGRGGGRPEARGSHIG